MSVEPYVGVTGFMTRDEVEKCLVCVPRYNLINPRVMMVGVLVSSKTITGNTNTLFNKFPRRENIADLFLSDTWTFNCLHFATREPEKLYDHLMMCLEYGGDNLDGIQLNMAWPDANVLRRIKDQKPDLKFILQISPHLPDYDQVAIDDIAVFFHMHYSGLADYVIVDFSRGLGKEMNPLEMSYWLDPLDALCPNFGLVIGGGLYAGNMRFLVDPLLNKYPDLSIDAEGKVRDNIEDGGGMMNIEKAQNYLRAGFARTYQKSDILME